MTDIYKEPAKKMTNANDELPDPVKISEHLDSEMEIDAVHDVRGEFVEVEIKYESSSPTFITNFVASFDEMEALIKLFQAALDAGRQAKN